MRFRDYLGKIREGESVLIEHTSLSPYHTLLLSIGEFYGWERLLLVDTLDSAASLVRTLHLSGTDIPGDVAHIKVGGSFSWGRVILKVNPHKDPGIFLSRFVYTLREYYSKNSDVVTLILNPERLVSLYNNDPNFILTVANLAAVFLGTPLRRTFYFFNRETGNARYLSLLEEAFTRVLRVQDDGKILVVKSPDLEEEGALLEVP
ncbi:hypothetical protein A3L09_00035 [Thermococcus profundus]|uniref:KaiC-like domain-containing protein n=1 Tax=Thermococcus profundus TaxID=49899 RepID=A0A2Z2MH34_THEPR|nr:DUF257 family protein [Thermococcus profundus]ASJ01761.1 hypothetical protein A3L09_00035 [Thermococcus profundus]